MNLRPEVQWFARAMERKLRENSHKEGWREIDTLYGFQRAMSEMAELAEAVFSGSPGDRVLEESADVANFLMMLAWSLR